MTSGGSVLGSRNTWRGNETELILNFCGGMLMIEASKAGLPARYPQSDFQANRADLVSRAQQCHGPR